MIERLIALLNHSTFWMGLFNVLYTLGTLYLPEFADSPITSKWLRIAIITFWVLWMALAGKLPNVPPGPLQRSKP